MPAQPISKTGLTVTQAEVLDRILELQFVVAWAGEGRAQPPRQPWWRTNWIDEYGGYDLLARMAPRTAAWAQYELARKAARTVDARGLDKQADAENIRTLFHQGPALDMELAERLLEHKKSESNPVETLPGLGITQEDWDPETFATYLRGLGEPRNFVNEPFGKRLTGDAPDEPVTRTRTLAQGLLPLSDTFPRPYTVI